MPADVQSQPAASMGCMLERGMMAAEVENSTRRVGAPSSAVGGAGTLTVAGSSNTFTECAGPDARGPAGVVGDGSVVQPVTRRARNNESKRET